MGIRISLTDFIDLVYSTGETKASKVKELRKRPKYDPRIDFWKILRESIIDYHKNDRRTLSIEKILNNVINVNKKNNYPILLEAYKKWLGKKTIEWFDPVTTLYTKNDVSISINPELGLQINGKKVLVKLYFKPKPLSVKKVKVANYLMSTYLKPLVDRDIEFGILDIRQKKLVKVGKTKEDLSAVLLGEIGYLKILWEEL